MEVPRAPLTQLRGWYYVAPTLVLVAVLLGPSLKLGFVSDDFLHLVEDSNLPLTASSDQLLRPLRNVIVKIAVRLFGLNPLPFHMAIVVFYALVAVLLFELIWELSRDLRVAGLTTALVAAFPRNHQVAFWFAAFQDLVVAVAALLTFILFLRHRKSGSAWYLTLAVLLFVISLGFKETAITVLPTLVLIDLFQGQRLSARWKAWKSHVPLICAAIAYLAYAVFVHHKGFNSVYYTARTPTQLLGNYFKDLHGLLVPFGAVPSLHQTARHPAILLPFVGGAAAICILMRALGKEREFLFCGAWIVVNLLPTAAFGVSREDRYLFIPFMGLAYLTSRLLIDLFDGASGIRGRTPVRAILFTAVLAYLGCSIVFFVGYRRRWSEAAQEVRLITEQVSRNARNLSSANTVFFLGVPHSIANGQVYVLNNGLRGVLLTRGFPRQGHLYENFSSSDMAQQSLMARIKACGHPGTSASSRTLILIYDPVGSVLDLSNHCAEEAISQAGKPGPQLFLERKQAHIRQTLGDLGFNLL